MILDFEKLNDGASAKQTDPRKIFSTLKRAARFKRPLDEQSDVLDAWYDRRTAKDLTIKMNTGGGKTAVGLLCLQSSLNEHITPTVYLTPNRFLVAQVLAEAHALGISATDNEKDPDFIAGRSVLVANAYKLFNGRSVFGVGEKKIPIGCIVVDDAHACLGVVNDQFRIKAEVGGPIYGALLDLFEEQLKAQSPTRLLDIKANDRSVVMELPYWAWQGHQEEVTHILHGQRDSDELEWNWPLLKECIPFCTCVFGGTHLEICPFFVPIDRIPSFAAAKRRIYMTATLADDTILVSHFQADASEVVRPIRPKGGGDIGDRMILAPQEINTECTVEEVKSLAANIAQKANVVVIVPSMARVEFWEDVSDQSLTKDNIREGVERLKAGHVGLTLLVNAYDGIDLPGPACELLIIDGLPEVYGLSERLEMLLLDGTKKQLAHQLQRVEQGMGRGVRSSDDHCVVLLLGGKLTQRIHQPEADEMFSSATRAQIALGREVSAQIRGKSLTELRPILDLCLDQEDRWVQAGRNAIVNAPAVGDGNIDANQVKLREAFDAARVSRYDIAIAKAQEAVNSECDDLVKGYLKQNLAQYTNLINAPKAQEIQLSAIGMNPRVLRPIAGTTYSKLSAPVAGQAAAATAFMHRFLGGNDLTIWVNGLLDDLNWGQEGSKRFEAAMLDVGSFLGFGSERPEEKFGRGPDNLWAIGSLKYLVIECKSGAVLTDRVSKGDTNQLNGSMAWFAEKYDSSCNATPIMVHPKIKFEHAASHPQGMRILDNAGLKRLRDAMVSYTVALSTAAAIRDARSVAKQLKHHRLSAADIVGLCTVSPETK